MEKRRIVRDERMMRWETASIVAAHRPRPTDPRDPPPQRTFVDNPAPINFLFLNRVLYGSMQCSWVLSKTHKRTRYNHLEADEGWFGLYVGSVCRVCRVGDRTSETRKIPVQDNIVNETTSASKPTFHHSPLIRRVKFHSYRVS